MSKPKYCKTPARDHERYTLTRKDIRHMIDAVSTIEDMIGYYINMAENKTGELHVNDEANGTLLDGLIDQLRDVANQLDYVDRGD